MDQPVTALYLLLIVAAFGLGVWWGVHLAHVSGRIDADIAKYLASPPAPDVTPTVPTK